MKIKNIRRYRKILKPARRVKARMGWLFIALAWLGGKLKWMKYLNPARYLKILDEDDKYRK